jgi:putative transposase
MSSSPVALRLATAPVVQSTLEEIARRGALQALQKAIEDEVAEYINVHRDQLDQAGHRLVVRNGHKPPRKILSSLGPIEVEQPRVDDRRVDENGVRFRFTSKILPPYLRKTKSIEDLVPWLYLKGILDPEWHRHPREVILQDAVLRSGKSSICLVAIVGRGPSDRHKADSATGVPAFHTAA